MVIMSFVRFLEVSYFVVLQPMDREEHSAVIASKSLTVVATAEGLKWTQVCHQKRNEEALVFGITFETRLIGTVDSDRRSPMFQSLQSMKAYVDNIPTQELHRTERIFSSLLCSIDWR